MIKDESICPSRTSRGDILIQILQLRGNVRAICLEVMVVDDLLKTTTHVNHKVKNA